MILILVPILIGIFVQLLVQVFGAGRKRFRKMKKSRNKIVISSPKSLLESDELVSDPKPKITIKKDLLVCSEDDDGQSDSDISEYSQPVNLLGVGVEEQELLQENQDQDEYQERHQSHSSDSESGNENEKYNNKNKSRKKTKKNIMNGTLEALIKQRQLKVTPGYKLSSLKPTKSLGTVRRSTNESSSALSKPFISTFSNPHRKSKSLENSAQPLRAKTIFNPIIKPFKSPSIDMSLPACRSQMRMRFGSTLGARRRTARLIDSLFSPNGDKAFCVYTPDKLLSQSEREAWLLLNPGKTPTFHVPTVVDPILSRILRPHQLAGVQFLYDCTTGVTVKDRFGAIMADEMGLGKTVQCITLLWTLLTQSPIPGVATIQKAIIVCPSSLVKNWANELNKWLGNRISSLSCDNKGTKQETVTAIQAFTSANGRSIVYPVLIISYESLRNYANVLRTTKVGLMLCDEGHRLKNCENMTYKALTGLDVQRRVILSGTPIQNDLLEFYSLLSFVCPGMFGTISEFRKAYESPILRGRDADATPTERTKGEEKLVELGAVSSKLIIRRTAELLTKYLPIKHDYVVFIELTEVQKVMYRHFSKMGIRVLKNSEDGDGVKKSSSGSGTDTLKAMIHLKKIVNHPALMDKKDIPLALGVALSTKIDQQESSKLDFLMTMITEMITTTTDKMVLISNYTATLDLIDSVLQVYRYGRFRLDGTMGIPKRQKIVDSFNDPTGRERVFLLSSKAGGCGINLIGANRLVLYDPDWNPANDAQAMARVWRDGQTKPCFLYRLISTGTIEEKIFQRQAHKQSLSSCVVDEEVDVERHFSVQGLKQLFMYNEKTLCDTHDMFKCKRCRDGKQFIRPAGGGAGATGADTANWSHFSQNEVEKVNDVMLAKLGKSKKVTFVFENRSQKELNNETKDETVK